MKLQVAKSDLEVALRVVSITVGTSTDLSSHYLFRLRDGQMEVLSYDMRVFSRAPFTATVEGSTGDAFTVEAWRLDKWVQSVGDGVLTLSSDEKGEVIAKGPRSRIKLRSLDPSKFPFWDGLLTSSVTMGEIAPAPLHRAISFTKVFVGTDDTIQPQLCQIEAADGRLRATNRRAVSSVMLRDLPGLSLRISSKDINAVLKFLSDKVTRESDVDVREASRPNGGAASAIFSRPDGSYLGVSRPTTPMPSLPIDVEAAEVSLTLNVEEFMGAVDLLLASAPKGHGVVKFSSGDGSLMVSVPSAAGGDDEYPLIVSSGAGMDDLTFSLDYSYIKALSDQFRLDTLVLGVHQRGRGGYVSFVHEDEGGTPDSGNQYHTVIVWYS